MSLLPPVVAELMANTKEFTAKMDEAQAKMEETAAEGESSLGGFASFGKTALLAVGAGAAAVGVMALDLGTKWQTSSHSLAASADISVKAANSIGNAFLGTAFNTTFSAQQIMAAYQPVAAQLGTVEGHALNAKQAMAVMSQAMDLAEASGTNLTSAASDLATIMQTYTLKAGDAANISNVLFNTARVTGQTVDSVTQAFTRLRAGLGSATPPLGQVGGLLTDLAAHGETGRKGLSAATTALTSLLTSSEGVTKAQQDQQAVFKEMGPHLQRLVQQYQAGALTYQQFYKQSQQLGQGQLQLVTEWNSAGSAVQAAQSKLAAMGITVDNASGKFVGMASVIAQLHQKIQGETQVQQLATLSQVFGTSAAQKLLGVVQAGPAAYDKATAAVVKTGSAHTAAAKNAATLKGEMEKLDHGFEDVVTMIGTRLVPVVTTLIGFILGLFKATGPTKDILIAVGIVIGGVLVAAISAYMISMAASVAATIAGTATMVVGWGSAAVAAIAAAAAFLLPILPFIILGAVVVAAIALIVTHFTQVRNFIAGVVNDLVGFFAALPGRVIGFVTGIGSSILSFFGQIPGKVMATLANWAGDFLSLGGNLVAGLVKGITGAIGKAVGAVKSLGSGIINAAKSLLGIFSPSTVFAEMGGNIAAGLAQGMTTSHGKVVSATSGLMGSVTSTASGLSAGAAAAGGGAASAAAARPIQVTYQIPVTGDVSPQTVDYLKRQLALHDAELQRTFEAMQA